MPGGDIFKQQPVTFAVGKKAVSAFKHATDADHLPTQPCIVCDQNCGRARMKAIPWPDDNLQQLLTATLQHGASMLTHFLVVQSCQQH